MKSNRREFFRGLSARDALTNIPANGIDRRDDDSDGSVAAAATVAARAGSYLTKVGRAAMACQFEVLLNASQHAHGTEAALAALDLVDQLEGQLSVFRSDSEVSRLNQSARIQPVGVEARLFKLLKLAAQIHRDTAGAYDITSGPLTKLWGFFRRQGRVPDEAELAEVMPHVGMRNVALDEEHFTVRFLTPEMEVNLGSIGKGYALDRMAELLAAEHVENFLLHGGNSSVLARGSGDRDSGDSRGWSIGLRHPLEPRRRIGEVRLRDRALGTSGDGTQFFIHEGRRYGHILDPRTGRPAENTLSTTVAAQTAAEADALATAFYVMGAERAMEYCRQHSGISAIVMSPAAEVDRAELAFYGWRDGELHLEVDDSLSVRRFDN